jgi:predicted AAA+ superfamily ATPase
MYPEIVELNQTDARERLELLAGDYLYRDILAFENLKKPELLTKLLKALAFQLGNEVTYRELAKLLNTSVETIERYITLLEQSFIIFRLHSFSRNLRNELKSGFKVYFWDLGIRNSLISSFNALENRMDIGALWENFCIVEKIKQNQALKKYGNMYFWRTYLPDKEIDLVIEKDGKLFAYEFKWNPKASGNARLPQNFLEAYSQGLDEKGNSKNVEFRVIDSKNWLEWVR